MSFFKRPATHYGKTPEPETPYQRAAQIWDDRIGSPHALRAVIAPFRSRTIYCLHW